MIASTAVFAASCDLSEYAVDEFGVASAFGNEGNVEMVIRNFYDNLPSVTSHYSGDSGSDYIAVTDVGGKYTKVYDANNGDNLSDFNRLRNYNYFLEKIYSSACPLDEGTKNNYAGIARWFRAEYYFDKVKGLGDIQWYDHVLSTTDLADQYKDRDSRKVVVGHILEDLDFAYNNISHTSPDKTTVDKWCAMFLKMRVCLFEASWQRYQLNNETEATKYYELAAAAAREIMDSKQFSLNSDYRQVFTSDALCQNEVILGAATGETESDKVRGSQNNYFNYFSGTYHTTIRPFVNIYLKADGTPYTNTAGFESQTFDQEFTGRDPRLTQTFRHPQYHFNGSRAEGAPNFSKDPLGYQVIKWVIDRPLDAQGTDETASLNTNSTPSYRYAEVLLSYAEAQAELGVAAENWWGETIGAIRKRAGFADAVANKIPTVNDIDTYLQTNFYPGITNPVILEIRREKMIEFAFEGQRKNDLKRWNLSDRVVKADWSGMYIPALDTPLDVNGDGVYDVYFSKSAKPAEHQYKDIWQQVDGETYNLGVRAQGTGFVLVFKSNPDNRYWPENGSYRDLAPIHVDLINDYKLRGYTLTQNPGY